MHQPELGKRLKEARIAKKMTQSEVVGTYITRNMLSQIESGKAMPSLETLQYLAGVLGLPPQSLVSSSVPLPDNTIAPPDAFRSLLEAKSALSRNNFATVLEYEQDYPKELEDEFQALLAIASCGMAEDLLNRSLPPIEQTRAIAKAVSLAQDAMMRSTKGIYANELTHSRALLLFNRAVQALSEQPYD